MDTRSFSLKLSLRIGSWPALALLSGLLLFSTGATAETLRVGRTENPTSLGNPFTSVGMPGSGVWTAIYDGLTMIDDDGNLVPALALSWENETPTTWVFRLRPDVSFHNGKPFDANTVAAVIDFLRNKDNAALYVAAEVKDIKKVMVRDELTIAFETREPDAIFPRRFNVIMMVEPDELAAKGMDDFALAPIGTGPFRLVDWGQQTQVTVLETNPNSWRASKTIDRLELLNLPDPSARVAALLTGAVDLIGGLSPDDASSVEGKGNRFITVATPWVTSIALPNVGNPDSPLQDQRVRQALNFAIDKQAIATALLEDRAQPASQGAAPITFGFNPALEPYAYDPARARQLLADGGYGDGFVMTIEVMLPNASDTLVFQKVAEDLRAVGVEVELQSATFGQWLGKFASNEWGDTDAFSFLWENSAYNDAGRAVRNYSCAKPKPFFCEPALMPLIEQSFQETDSAKREKLLQTIMSDLRDLAPSIYLMTGTTAFGLSERIEDFYFRPHGIMYERVTFSDDG